MQDPYKEETEKLLERLGGDLSLYAELWQNGLMNEIRRRPNLVPPEDGRTPPSLKVPFYSGDEKAAFGYRAGMSCITQLEGNTLQLRYVDFFPACILVALISLWYDAHKNGQKVKCTLLIPVNEDGGTFRSLLSRVCAKVTFVTVETRDRGTSPTPTVPKRRAKGDMFVPVRLQQVDIGRFFVIGNMSCGSFSAKDRLTLTDGSMNVLQENCPVISVSQIVNGVDRPASVIRKGDGLCGVYMAFWFPPNTAFDSFYLVKEDRAPTFVPERMPNPARLAPESKGGFWSRLFK